MCICQEKYSFESFDWPMANALIEQWNPLTNTFILPIGEMYILVEEVSTLLGVNEVISPESRPDCGCHPMAIIAFSLIFVIIISQQIV